MSWLSRLRNAFRPDRLHGDLDEELQFHIESRAKDLGMPEEHVRSQFGNSLRLREESHDIKVAISLETLLQDIRTAIRIWAKRPAGAVAAVLTIALGAGLNIAMMQLIWTVMLKPLPYHEPARLVQIWVHDGREERRAPDTEVIEAWRDDARTLSHLASYRAWRVTVAAGGDPQQVTSALISPEFFDTLGVRLLAGRAFTKAEVRPGADNVVLLREGYWRQKFGADYSLIGRDVSVDGMSCRVAGIVPDTFSAAIIGTKIDPDVYLPISRAHVAGMLVGVRNHFAIGRLKDGVSVAAATQELSTIMSAKDRRRVWLSPLQREVGRSIRPALIALFAATVCVLLIACSNLANLMMSQAMTRRRELSIRAALGATQYRILRQLLTETGVLLTIGTITGIVLAQGVLHSLVKLYPDGIPRSQEASSLWPMHIVAMASTLLVGLIFGTLPAWRATRATSEASLRVSGNLWMSRGNRRWTDAMVAVQVGLTAVVLISAGILFKTFLHLRDVDVGVAREHVITGSVDLPASRYKTREDRARFGEVWLQKVQAIPGISAAGISNSLPLRYTTLLDILVRLPGQAEEQKVPCRAVSGDYFNAIGLRFTGGREFDERRKDQVVVNEAFVGKHLGGTRFAVGTPLGTEKNPLLITGVVRDVRHVGLREAAQPELYLPFASFPLNPIDTVIRSSAPQAAIEAAMRRALREIDDQLAVARFMSMEQVVDEQLARPRFQAVLLGLFAAVALTLAAVGTYGVIAQTVRSRVPEIALRRALGADTRHLAQMVVGDGMKAPAVGLIAGVVVGVFGAGHWLKTLVYDVTPNDPSLLLIIASVLLINAFLACLLPARVAVSVDPGKVLKQD